MLSYVWLPRKGNHGVVTEEDLVLLWAMVTKVKLNWAYLIARRLRLHGFGPIETGLGHAVLWTKIFEHLGIDLSGEKAVLVGDENAITLKHLNKMGRGPKVTMSVIPRITTYVPHYVLFLLLPTLNVIIVYSLYLNYSVIHVVRTGIPLPETLTSVIFVFVTPFLIAYRFRSHLADYNGNLARGLEQSKKTRFFKSFGKHPFKNPFQYTLTLHRTLTGSLPLLGSHGTLDDGTKGAKFNTEYGTMLSKQFVQ
ncbi:hypothetical protein PIB30_051164 [Stylosanthes scabra]|uniref:Uncharacterized protein n=1 Tax=Stylosanthes scabra TaxID=79078 RepID=A0ABU6THK4_9FABA|nr:hypothetical protein [Stylosanthes scabra]